MACTDGRMDGWTDGHRQGRPGQARTGQDRDRGALVHGMEFRRVALHIYPVSSAANLLVRFLSLASCRLTLRIKSILGSSQYWILRNWPDGLALSSPRTNRRSCQFYGALPGKGDRRVPPGMPSTRERQAAKMVILYTPVPLARGFAIALRGLESFSGSHRRLHAVAIAARIIAGRNKILRDDL